MKRFDLIPEVSDLWIDFNDARGIGTHNRPTERVLAPYAAAVLLLRWAEHTDIENEAVATFDGDDYVPVLPQSLHWSSWSKLQGKELSDLLIKKVVSALRISQKISLGHTIQRLLPVIEELVSEPPEAIERLTQWSKGFELENYPGRQMAVEALEALIYKAAEQSSGTMGAFAVPNSVVELMVELLDPRPGQRIYDPSFGIGDVLVSVASRLREQAMRMPATVWTQTQQQSLFGLEIDPYRFSIGFARVVLAGVEQPGLEIGSDVGRPRPEDLTSQGFDGIVTVVPSIGVVHSAISKQYAVPSTNLETLFLQQVMSSLRTGGRAVIALPEGVLFRIGPDRSVRKKLLSDYCVEGVISLPEGACRPYTGLKMSLVLFSRQKAKQTVRFMQVDKWPSVRQDDGFSRQKAVTAARSIAEEFRKGTRNGNLWETPIQELKTRDWELIVKRTGEEALSRFLTEVDEADPGIPIRTLHDAADIFPGIAYDRSLTTSHDDDPSVYAGIVRISDITQTSLRSPSIFLIGKGSERVESKDKLQVGDVILSTSGTIGELAVITEPARDAGIVASKNITVIRPGRGISSEFLKSLLSSDTYQQWIRGHARGSTIQHLPIRALSQLRVPIPHIQIQRLFELHEAGQPDDPLVALMRMLVRGSDDPVEAWLLGSSEVLELRRDDVDSVAIMQKIAKSVVDLRNQIAHLQVKIRPLLDRWIREFADVLRAMRNIDSVPRGAGRMAIIDRALLRLEHVEAIVEESSLPAYQSARDVTTRISQLLRTDQESILNEVSLEPSIEPEAVVAGKENEIQVRVKNLSSLALRNVSLSTSPSVGEGSANYLPENMPLSFPAKIPARADTGPFAFRLQWRAERLDGLMVSGEQELAVDVRSTREATRVADIGSSPYIVGSPVDREEMFYGRQSIIDQIRRQLSPSHRANVILLEGNRRIGKTSILRHLQVPDVLPDWIVVNSSLQGGEGHQSEAGLTTNELFRHMARDIAWAMDEAGLQVWLPDIEPPDTSKRFKLAFGKASSTAFSGSRPFEVFELYMQSVLEAASPRRLLLMLDEFDKLPEGIDSGVTSPQVPENIRYLLHTYQGLSAILCGSRQLKRLREQYQSALFGIGYRVTVSEIPKEDARLLITRPVDGRLTYVPDATNLAIELCARHPFLIQSLCARIFDWAARTNERTVTKGAVETAVQEMVRDNEHFDTLWNYAQTERRRFLLALCRKLKGGPDPITLSLLETKVEEYGIAVPHGDSLGEDLESLRELELIELQDTMRASTYKFAVPLMEDWIGRNIDFEHQRQKAVQENEELDTTRGFGSGEGDGRGLPDGSGFGAGSGQSYGSRGTEGEQ